MWASCWNVMDRGSRSITEWRLRLEPVLVVAIRRLHETAGVHMRFLTGDHVGPVSTQTEERRSILKWQSSLTISAFR